MTDTWKEPIAPVKLDAYRQLIEAGLIVNPKVTYNRTTKITTVEYSSELPHERVLQELRKAAERMAGSDAKGT